MISQEVILTRNKIIGVLLRDARLRAKLSVQECAQAIFCDPQLISRAEEGSKGLSLPQLEILAHVLQVPLSYFLGEGELPAAGDEPQLPPYADIITIRRKIIGVMLRQARLEADRTEDQVAATLGYTPDRLTQVELGEAQITLVELEALAKTLSVPFESLIAEDVMPALPEEDQELDLAMLEHLSPDIQSFILKPINTPYLQIAMNLSEMPADTLRQIASGLLEITY
jgi:transcriptional regulator with XRE-family HTH domain